ncbi:hypothetical protein Tco_0339173 [Tanacetum coccineum]
MECLVTRYGVRTLGIRGYGDDMVVCHGLKGCLDHWIQGSSPLLPPLPIDLWIVENNKQKVIGESSSGKGPTITKSAHDNIPPSTTDQPHDYEMNRIKSKGFNMMKKRFISIIEFEYNMEQVALAMSKDIRIPLIKH